MTPDPLTPSPEPAHQNTDRELWRAKEGDYYSPSIHVTKHGNIGINVDGTVFVMPVEAWHALANTAPSTPSPDSPTPQGVCRLCKRPTKPYYDFCEDCILVEAEKQKNTNSPTPRTDAALRALVLVGIKYGFSEGLLHDFAKDSRQLERENAALVKEREELKEALQEVSRSKVAGDQLIAKYLEEIEDLKAEVQRDREIMGLNEAWDNALTLSRTLGTELETLRAQLAETQHARDVASNAASRFKQAYEEANAKLSDAKEALEAFSVFVTPLALSRKPDRQWDEFEFDAIKRRNAILTPA